MELVPTSRSPNLAKNLFVPRERIHCHPRSAKLTAEVNIGRELCVRGKVVQITTILDPELLFEGISGLVRWGGVKNHRTHLPRLACDVTTDSLAVLPHSCGILSHLLAVALDNHRTSFEFHGTDEVR